MEASLRRLLEALERIGKDHEEVYDSEVRHRLGSTIFEGFLKPKPNYSVPSDLGMLSIEANREVQSALQTYVEEANRKAQELGLSDFHTRLAAFQNAQISTSEEGNYHDDFFGWWNPAHFDTDGNAIR